MHLYLGGRDVPHDVGRGYQRHSDEVTPTAGSQLASCQLRPAPV